MATRASNEFEGLAIACRAFLPCVICLVVLSSTVFAVYNNSISGKVVDAKTGESIYFVNVFLAGTTIGTTSNRDGEFSFSNVPPGMHNLVVQHISYELMAQKIDVFPTSVLNVLIKLTPRVIEGKEISVTAENPSRWRKQYKIFEREFLGTSKYAQDCKIINPFAIDFEESKDGRCLRAKSDSAVLVENHALGYYEKHFIRIFSYTPEQVLHSVYSFFQAMEARSPEQQQQWDKQRIECFQGSFKHFLSAFARQTLAQEGFVLQHGADYSLNFRYMMPIQPRHLYENITRDDLVPLNIELGQYRHKDLGDIYIPVGLPEHKMLYFNDWLQVTYAKVFSRPSSLLTFGGHIAFVDTLGNILAPIYRQVRGEWTSARIAALLPDDYIPPLAALK